MTYDVFLSYSRKDVDWAIRLEQGLKGRGLSVFRDASRLTAGERWDEQLQGAITQARNLVVLWSDNARASDWVFAERSMFQADMRNSRQTRRLIHVNLQGQFAAAGPFEQVDDINTVALYDQGAAALDAQPGVLLKVLNKVEEAARADNSIVVMKVLMTSRLSSLQGLPLTMKARFAPNFGETLQAIGIRTDDTTAWKNELAKYDSENRGDWRPFGAGSSIDQILSDVRDSIQKVAGAPRFRWRELDEEFWSDELFDTVVGNIAQHLALIVIDPLSLYDPDVANRLPTLHTKLQAHRCVTVFLAPFAIPAPSFHLRKVVKGAAVELFTQYYDPPFNGSTRLPMSVCAHDDLDLRRVLSAGLDGQVQRGTDRASDLPRLG